MDQRLEDANELETQGHIARVGALKLRQDYLKSRGWEIKDTYSDDAFINVYIYSKGDYITICEDSALEYEEFECTEPS